MENANPDSCRKSKLSRKVKSTLSDVFSVHPTVSCPKDTQLRLIFISYRITLSALASTLGGIVRPICLAAGRLITSSLLLLSNVLINGGHLITLSALARMCGEMVTPICFAVFKLITISNLVGCSTGMSAGLAPFKILAR